MRRAKTSFYDPHEPLNEPAIAGVVCRLRRATMRDLDALCLPPRPDYGGAEVRRIRAAARMSQPVFARLLGVDKSAVARWERGVKRPSGPVARLLEVLDPKRTEASPIMRMQREMSSAA